MLAGLGWVPFRPIIVLRSWGLSAMASKSRPPESGSRALVHNHCTRTCGWGHGALKRAGGLFWEESRFPQGVM